MYTEEMIDFAGNIPDEITIEKKTNGYVVTCKQWSGEPHGFYESTEVLFLSVASTVDFISHVLLGKEYENEHADMFK